MSPVIDIHNGIPDLLDELMDVVKKSADGAMEIAKERAKTELANNNLILGPQLSEFTMAERRAMGIGSTNFLVRTGGMVDSLKHLTWVMGNKTQSRFYYDEEPSFDMPAIGGGHGIIRSGPPHHRGRGAEYGTANRRMTRRQRKWFFAQADRLIDAGFLSKDWKKKSGPRSYSGDGSIEEKQREWLSLSQVVSLDVAGLHMATDVDTLIRKHTF